MHALSDHPVEQQAKRVEVECALGANGVVTAGMYPRQSTLVRSSRERSGSPWRGAASPVPSSVRPIAMPGEPLGEPTADRRHSCAGVDELEVPRAVERHELDLVAGLARGLGVGAVRLEVDVGVSDGEHLAQAERESRRGEVSRQRSGTRSGPPPSRRVISPLSSPRRWVSCRSTTPAAETTPRSSRPLRAAGEQRELSAGGVAEGRDAAEVEREALGELGDVGERGARRRRSCPGSRRPDRRSGGTRRSRSRCRGRRGRRRGGRRA